MIMNSKTLSDAINGGLSASLTAFVTQPLQVIRTSMIVIYKEGKVSRMRDIYSKILKDEGMKGFYRGLVPSLLKTTIGSAIYFACLERCKDFFHNKHIEDKLKNRNKRFKQNFVNFTSAAIARIVQTILINPIYVVKTRYEVVGFKSYNSIIDAFIKIKRDEGYGAYFHGLRQTLVKDVPSSAVFYLLYEFFKRTYTHYFDINNLQFLASLSSLTTNIILIFLTNPFDVLRARLQFQHFSQNAHHKYKGIVSGIYHLAVEEGVRGLCVGVIPRFIKKAISSIIVWTSYETLKLKSQKQRDLFMQNNKKSDFSLKD